MNLFRAIKLALRRRRLCASPPPCPCCSGGQVQLVDWLRRPALWRCRVCKVSWWQEKKDALPVAYGHPLPPATLEWRLPPDYAVAPQAPPNRWSKETWRKIMYPDKHAKQ